MSYGESGCYYKTDHSFLCGPDQNDERGGPLNIIDLLRFSVDRKASDLHVSPGNVPFIRVDGELLPAPFPILTSEETRLAAESLMPDHKADEFARTHEADFAFSLDEVGRFRVNVLRQQGDVGLAIRWVSAVPPTFADLNLPAVIPTLVEVRHGLVLVTGPTGSGKTTTIASLVGFINRTRRAHILTIEDPVEVIHVDDMGIVRQREVGLDTESYETGLRQVLRQDPDVVFVGEIREPSSAMAAIQAAQTGHLVMSTMHTIDAEETINRLIDLFPPGQQQQARLSLGGALRGIISQRLLERLDRVGRIPATEVMINTGRVRSALTSPEGMGDLTRLLEESSFDGMHSFDQDLLRLTKDGFVSEADALMVATNPHDFGIALQSVTIPAPAASAGV